MKTESVKLVNESILREIDRKKKMLEMVPEYCFYYSNGRKKAMQKEFSRHSASLELEGLYDTRTVYGRKEKARELHRCEKNLDAALDWALAHYSGQLSKEFLEEIGKRVDPAANSRGYRDCNVRIAGSLWSPPSYVKLGREIGLFVFENSCLENPIEAALHAHFDIARIHPFADGNGRSARLVQNVMLDKAGFLPVVIKNADRLEYLQLMDKAVSSYRIAESSFDSAQEYEFKGLLEALESGACSEKKQHLCKEKALKLLKIKTTAEQHDFYNFLAMKIRDSFQQVGERLYYSIRKR